MDPAAIQNLMLSNPEIMQLAMKPGMMEKITRISSNPSSISQYSNDQDVMAFVNAMQNAMGQGGSRFGNGGGGGGAFGNSYQPTSQPSQSSSEGNIIHINSKEQFNKILSSEDKLIVVDFFTTWCGPCKMIAPTFISLSLQYKDTAIFLKVDGDQNRDLVSSYGVTGFPTFSFFKNGSQIYTFSGADGNKLTDCIEKYTLPPPSQYKHFPMKFDEIISFKPIKFDLLLQNLKKFNTELLDTDNKLYTLTNGEIKLMDDLAVILDNRVQYHQSVVSVETFNALFKMLKWPVKSALPALNIFRVLPFHPAAAKYLSDNLKSSNDLISSLLKLINGDVMANPAVTSVILRIFCNFFSRRALALSLLDRFEEWSDSISGSVTSTEDSIRGSWISLVLNSAVLICSQNKNEQYELCKMQLITSVIEFIQVEKNKDTAYKACVCLGTLLFRDPQSQVVASSLDLDSALALVTSNFSNEENIKKCCEEISTHLSTGK